MSIETSIIAIAPIVNGIIDLFRRHQSKADAINRDFKKTMMGEHIMGPLVDMHSSLSRADSALLIYRTLLMNASGQFRDILVRNQYRYFFDLAQSYFRDFRAGLDKLETIGQNGGNQIIQSVKGNACPAASSLESQIQSQEQYISNIVNSGSPVAVNDVTTMIQFYENFIDCYLQGLNRSFQDLAHIC